MYQPVLKMSDNIHKDFKLIDGSFSKSEALIVLKDVLEAKINFHKLQGIANIDTDINDVHSLNNYRISQLIKEKENINVFLEALESDNCKIKITSTVHITVQK